MNDEIKKMITIPVKEMSQDYWSRPRVKTEKGIILVDVSCGTSVSTRNGIRGDWNTVLDNDEDDGEPLGSIKESIELVLINK